MNKKLIRLTEQDLHRIVKESVNKILTELDWKTYANAARKASDRAEWGKLDRAEKFADAATKEFNKKYGVKSDEPEWMTPNRYAAKIGFNGSRRPGAGMVFHQRVNDNLHTSPKSKYLDYYEKNHYNRGTDRWRSYDWPAEGGNWEDTKGERAAPRNTDWPEDFDSFNYIKDTDVKDRAYKGDEELKNYYTNNYDYQKGKGWNLKH